jgi:hypothetical protein
MNTKIVLFLALMFSQAGFAKIVGNKFSDVDSGFAISKPADWEFVATPKGHGLKLKDNSVMKPGITPIVTFAKILDKSFTGVRPTVGVDRRTLPKKMSPVEWLKGEVQRQATHDKYYVPASGAIETVIDEVPNGARAAWVNSIEVQGREQRVYHAVYVVPSRGKIYLINMNCSDALMTQYIDQFAKIAESIEAKLPD